MADQTLTLVQAKLSNRASSAGWVGVSVGLPVKKHFQTELKIAPFRKFEWKKQGHKLHNYSNGSSFNGISQ